jgi:hypothetical protein
LDNELRKKILYEQLNDVEERIGLLDGQKLELMNIQSTILDELEKLGEKVTL